MQAPSILQGESRTRLLQGIAIGAIAIGFCWGGWMTSRTAKISRGGPRRKRRGCSPHADLCGENQASDAKENLAALQKISSNWEQG
jgi:hypothetical protein